MNPYMSYTPYMPQDAYMQDQMALRQRIDNLSQAQQQYKAQPQPNVNWIQVGKESDRTAGNNGLDDG